MARRPPLLTTVAAAACAPAKPPSVEVIATTNTNTPASRGPVVFKVDGVSLGGPISGLASKYGDPCDIDPIDEKRATLWFWAGGKCREAKPFPLRTTVVIVTEGADERGNKDAPITLIVWAGGTYFDDKTNLGVKLGDSLEHARSVFGPESDKKTNKEGEEGNELLSWRDDVHVVVERSIIVVLAIGSLRGGSERQEVPFSTLHHHRRYTRTNL